MYQLLILCYCSKYPIEQIHHSLLIHLIVGSKGSNQFRLLQGGEKEKKKKSTMSIYIHAFVWSYAFVCLKKILISRLTGSWDRYIFTFLINCQTIFPNGCIIVHFHQQCTWHPWCGIFLLIIDVEFPIIEFWEVLYIIAASFFHQICNF